MPSRTCCGNSKPWPWSPPSPAGASCTRPWAWPPPAPPPPPPPRRPAPVFIATVTGLLRRVLDQVKMDLSTQTTRVDGVDVLEFSGNDDAVEILPVALLGASRTLRSRSCPPAVARD